MAMVRWVCSECQNKAYMEFDGSGGIIRIPRPLVCNVCSNEYSTFWRDFDEAREKRLKQA